MNHSDQGHVREFLRNNRELIFGCKYINDLTPLIADMDSGLEKDDITKFLYRVPLQLENSTKVSSAALQLVFKLFTKIENHKKSVIGADLIFELLTKYDLLSTEMPSNRAIVFDALKHSSYHGDNIILTGIYQVYRRQKPLPSQEISPQDQLVACELLYIDSHKMECWLVTNERHLYRGFVHINLNMMAYIILQRRDGVENNIECRFLQLKLEGKMRCLPGLMMRTGECTMLPLTYDCFGVFVHPTMNHVLYATFKNILKISNDVIDPNEHEVIFDYMTDADPQTPYDESAPEWQNIKRVKDFPLLSKIVEQPLLAKGFFREPSRALSKADYTALTAHGTLSVYKKMKD